MLLFNPLEPTNITLNIQIYNSKGYKIVPDCRLEVSDLPLMVDFASGNRGFLSEKCHEYMLAQTFIQSLERDQRRIFIEKMLHFVQHDNKKGLLWGFVWGCP